MDRFEKFIVDDEENRFLACIEGSGNQNLTCAIIDLKNDEPIFLFLVDNVHDFVNSIPKFFNEAFKAVILEVFNFYLFLPYKNNHEFCQTLKAKFAEAQIQSYFLTNPEWLLARVLALKSYTSKINDVISTLMVTDKVAFITDYTFTKNGYKLLCHHISPFTTTAAVMKKEIFRNNPKAVFIIETECSAQANMTRLKSILPKSSAVIYASESDITDSAIIKALKQIIDKDFIQCKFVPHCFKECVVRSKSGPSLIFATKLMAELPLRNRKTVDKLLHEIIVTSEDHNMPNMPVTLYSCKPSSMAHKHEVVLEIDKENFVSWEVKPLILEEIQRLPIMLGKKKVKIPVIAFLNNLSFICFRVADDMDFEFLQSWKGIYGTDLYLSFDQEKPSFGENAVKCLQTNPTSVAYEKFKGEKPKEVGFVLFDKYDGDGRKRVEAGIKKSCEMLNVSCNFIQV
uniref:Uncharacterized protein n=1 Tax=Panagrolaimus sp. ES5 TaxID=591445 RepID=A0AC34F9W2_9BILA